MPVQYIRQSASGGASPDGSTSAHLIAPLIRAIQEQDATIRSLADRVAALEPR
jgi:hypothetical protein